MAVTGLDRSGAVPSMQDLAAMRDRAEQRAADRPPGPRRASPTRPRSSPSRTSKSTGPAFGVINPRTVTRVLPALGRGLLEHVEQGPADDQPHQVLGRSLADRLLADELAVAQHDDAVGDAEDLVEPVRHVDHADALFAQAPQRREQPLHLIGRQARRRLVEHEEIAIDDERAGDGDQRLLGAADRLDTRVVGSISQPTSASALAARASAPRQSMRPNGRVRGKPWARPTFSATVIHSMRPRS